MVKEMKRKAAYNDGWASKARIGRAPARAVRGARAAAREGRRAGRPDAARRRPHRQGRVPRAGARDRRDRASRSTPRSGSASGSGVIGPNGTGKTHFLRLLAGEDIAHEGEWMLGARVDPALFAQLHERPDIGDRPILEVLLKKGLDR